jgi:hypothetical protein
VTRTGAHLKTLWRQTFERTHRNVASGELSITPTSSDFRDQFP